MSKANDPNIIFDAVAQAEDSIGWSRRQFVGSLAALPFFPLLGLSSESALAARRVQYDSPTEAKVEAYVKQLRRQGRLRADERTSWSVYDFSMAKKLVSINEDTPFQSASMIKPFVALAFFCKLNENQQRIHYTAKHRRTMEAMIRNSNNAATNRIMRLVSPSPKGVERVLKRHAPGIFQNTAIVERIPRNGRSYRNKASARDYSRFLYALWHDQLPYSLELKELMHLSNKDRIYYGADKVARATEVYDKTGTTARLCGNMGILVAHGKDGRRYPYTFIGIIEKARRARRFGRWSATRGNVIREVSNIVYSDLKRIHNLV